MSAPVKSCNQPLYKSEPSPVQVGLVCDGLAIKLTPTNQSCSYQTTLNPNNVTVYHSREDTTVYARVQRAGVQVGVEHRMNGTCTIL